MTKCYAESLGDCVGVITREHFISKCILERLGSRFIVDGLPWAFGSKELSPASFASKMLCERHNGALGELDGEALRLLDILETLWAEQQVGTCVINGDLIERWAIKALAGMLSSGNVSRTDGARVKDMPAADWLTQAARQHYLSVLFGERAMPDGWGFYLFLSPSLPENQIELVLNTHPRGHPEAGLVYAITVRMHGLYFSTAFTTIASEHERLWYRPRCIDFDGLGRIELKWKGASSGEIVELQ